MWRQHQITFCFLGLLLFIFVVQGCDNFSMEETGEEEGLSRQQICRLISDREAENLVGIPLHVSSREEDTAGDSSCTWLNSEGVPWLILKYRTPVGGPLLSWLKANTTGDYELFTVPGAHGDIGVVYTKGNPAENITPGISMVAVRRGEELLTFSAPLLKAEKGSRAYTAWLELADNIAGRFGGGGEIRD